jgi:hypothetical protein
MFSLICESRLKKTRHELRREPIGVGDGRSMRVGEAKESDGEGI